MQGRDDPMRELADEVRAFGWGRLPLLADDPVAAELNESRRQAASLFRDLLDAGSLTGQRATSTGQYGFTEAADEGEVGFVEQRSHYVFNQAVPDGHPLRTYAPEFYGESAVHDPDALALADLAMRLHELLDLVTMAFLERLEVSLGLPFGHLAAPIAMGERLLRFQWYPPPPSEGILTRFVAETDVGDVPIWGHEARGRRLVRASPHSDTGCWTWQVFATDEQLRFWDRTGRRVVAVEAGDVIYGNVCDFLEQERPELHSPVHWVDADDTTAGRISISYFVHHRPGATVRGRSAGVRLYERLRELGYVDTRQVEAVERLLGHATSADAAVVREALAWEADHGLCDGFGVPLSRYYAAAQERAALHDSRPGPLTPSPLEHGRDER
jgi:isopenicillin N synthase-like dioxygenase